MQVDREAATILDLSRYTLLPFSSLRVDPKTAVWTSGKVNNQLLKQNDELVAAGLDPKDLLANQVELADFLFAYWSFQLDAYIKALRGGPTVKGMRAWYSHLPTYFDEQGLHVRHHPRNCLSIKRKSEYEEDTLVVDNPDVSNQDLYTFRLRTGLYSVPTRVSRTTWDIEAQYVTSPQVLHSFSISQSRKSMLLDLDEVEAAT